MFITIENGPFPNMTSSIVDRKTDYLHKNVFSYNYFASIGDQKLLEYLIDMINNQILTALAKFSYSYWKRFPNPLQHVSLHKNLVGQKDMCDVSNSSSRYGLIISPWLSKTSFNILLFNEPKRLQHAVYTVSRVYTLKYNISSFKTQHFIL